MRSPVQFPKVNLDFTFHASFSSPKLDLGRGSFSQPRFDARPVVSVDRAESPQVIQQTNVAGVKIDTVKVSDSVLSLNKNVGAGLDLKTKSITPPQQTPLPSQPIKGRVLDLVPVSYTHLDVYKRQPQLSLGRLLAEKKKFLTDYIHGMAEIAAPSAKGLAETMDLKRCV